MIEAALDRLDMLLRREAARVRARVPRAEWQDGGWYVSDEHFDRLLAEPAPAEEPASDISREAADAALNAHPPWRRLIEELDLGPFERDVVLLALAPELDLRYETILGYLNDDLTRRRPTRALALRALGGGPGERAAVDDAGRLLAAGVLRTLPAADGGWLAAGLALTPTALGHLLELPPGDAELQRRPLRAVPDAPPEQQRWVRRLAKLARACPEPPIVVTAENPNDLPDLLDLLAAELEVPVLELPAATEAGVRRAALARRLSACVVAVRDLAAAPEALMPLLGAPGIVVLPGAPDGTRAVEWRRRIPAAPERRTRWRAGLASAGLELRPAALERVAQRFALDAGQIARAVRLGADTHALAGRDGAAEAAVLAAARRLTSAPLRALTVPLPLGPTWDDLVLPDATLHRLREVAGALAGAEVVYGAWAFETRTANRRGVNVLFSGSSGTGKTLAARVLAGELGVDLFAIDLSGVVSKYIGETEKNLDRIFAAAEGSNALLLFDEADALFGKRSEVRDAHDRYANIEVAYLLQKLEQHDGAVVLATNLGGNLDAAFSRRMHYAVEFPLPAAELRERLWHGMFPSEAPLAPDVDLPWLAHQFSLSGGEIRTVVLDAAFTAAGDGRVITMTQLVRAMARQLAKRGRTASALEFQQYHALLGPAP